MADAAVLQEFFVGLNIKIPTDATAKFNGFVKSIGDSLGGLDKQLTAVEKRFADLGQRVGKGIEPDLTRYNQNVDKIRKQNFEWGKSLAELSRGAIAFGTAFSVTLNETVRNYQQLDIAARRAGVSIANMLQIQAGTRGLGGGIADQIAGQIQHFGQIIQGYAGIKPLLQLRQLITPEDREAVKKQFGDQLEPAAEAFYAFVHRMQEFSKSNQLGVRNLVRQFAEDLQVPMPLLQTLFADWDRMAANIKKAGEDLKAIWGPNAKQNIETFSKSIGELSDAFARLETTLGSLKDRGLNHIIDGLTAAITGLNNALVELGKHTQGSPAAETAVSGGLIATAAGAGYAALRVGGGIVRHILGLPGAGGAGAGAGAGARAGAGAGLASRLPKAGGALLFLEALREYGEGGGPLAELGKALGDVLTGHVPRWGSAREDYERGKAGLPPTADRPVWATPTVPAEGMAAAPSMQHGGIVPINAHPGEMVLPSYISLGLQQLLATRRPFDDSQDAFRYLVQWLQGITVVPFVNIKNIDELANALARDLISALTGHTPGDGSAGAAAGNDNAQPIGRTMGAGGQYTPQMGGPPGHAGPAPYAEGGPVSNVAPGKGDFAKRAAAIMPALMKDLNLTKDQAAGLLGNLGAESGLKGVQEGKPISGRGGFGWAQWTGARRIAFEKYAQEHHLDIKSDQANYGFLVEEMRAKFAPFLARLRQTQGVAASTRLTHEQYETPADVLGPHPSYASAPRRLAMANAARNADALTAGLPKIASNLQSLGKAPALGAGAAGGAGKQMTVNVTNSPSVTINGGKDAGDTAARYAQLQRGLNSDMLRNLKQRVLV